MASTRRKENVRGAVISIPTATNRKYELNIPAMKDQVEWIVDQGVRTGKGVVMLGGGSGEGYFLPWEDHKRIIKTLVDAANGKVPTMTGIFEVNTDTAVMKAKYASDAGVDFIQYNPAHYEMPGDDEVLTHYKLMSDKVDVGIVAYNSPWATMNYEFTAPTIKKLSELENVWGIKWWSAVPGNYVQCMAQYADKVAFVVNTGPYTQYRALAYLMGAKGFISALGIFNPKAELRLLDLLERGKFEEYITEDEKFHSYEREIAGDATIVKGGVGEGTLARGEMLAVGKDFGPPYRPQREMTKEDIEKMRKIIKKAKLI
ncbi:MAG: dihydrodipicolinate synthase family protein [Thaumarchaeota archaeon]|nr:dihydrodipicolinate synthase family protein [Nitrososphaerota archaeon]